MNSEKIKNVEKKVEEILINCETARVSDTYLYMVFLQANQYSIEMKVSCLFSLIEKRIIPNFDSVSRARRNLQHKERLARAKGTFNGESVLPSVEIERYRAEQEQAHRDYYREE